MNTLNLIILVGAVAVGLYIVFKVASKVLKFVAIILIAALVVYFWQGGSVSELKSKGVEKVFKGATIAGMMDQYCTPADADGVKCKCIVSPVYLDLSTRFTQKQIAEIDKDEARIQDEIRKSLKNKQKEVQNCLVKNKGSDYLDKLKDVWGKVKDFATEPGDSASSEMPDAVNQAPNSPPPTNE